MKKIVVLFLIAILTVNLNGKTRVYTCNDRAFGEMASARLASALLKENNDNLLFTLLDNPNERLAIKSIINLDNSLSMVNASKLPRSFTDENVASIFQSIKAEIAKSETLFCFVSNEALYFTKAKKDYDYLNKYQNLPFNSYYFQEAVRKSGAKTHNEKIKVLKEWIDKVMNQPIRASTDPWKLL